MIRRWKCRRKGHAWHRIPGRIGRLNDPATVYAHVCLRCRAAGFGHDITDVKEQP